MLASDTMTMSGHMLGISRYGIVKEKPSVLARASFETPLKHIFNAAITGEEDSLNSVIENVMLNQPVPLGTGLPKIVVKHPGKKAAKKAEA
jgi:DNA-directed RNA polymerase subunit A"